MLSKALARRPDDRYQTMDDLRMALLDADRAPVVVPDVTRTMVTPPPAPRFIESERRWLVLAVFMAIVAVSLAVAGVLIGRTDTGHEIVRRAKGVVGAGDTAARGASTTTPTVTGVPISLRAAAFDPQGDGTEHDNEAANAVDGDPTTRWSTEGYKARDFGTKAGVGLAITLPSAQQLSSITVTSSVSGWSGEIHLADAPGDTLDAWGPAIDPRTNINGAQRFDTAGRRAQYVLLWITDLGSGNPPRMDVGEITVAIA